MFPSLPIRPAGGAVRGFLLAALVLCAVTPALADVTLKEKSVSNGFMGMGTMTSDRTMVISGDKCRVDDTSLYTGRMQTFMGGGKPRTNVTITRVDRGLLWTLDPAKSEYTEMNFADLRTAMESGRMGPGQDLQHEDKRDKVEMTYTVDVKRTGKHETVNGHGADQWIITLTATPKDKSSGKEMGAFTMTMDEWIAGDLPGSAEMQAYYRAFSEKLGLDAQAQSLMNGMMSQYRDAVKQLAEKMKEMRGTPVRTTLTMDMTGGNLTPEQKARMDKARAEGEQAQREHAQEQREAEAREGESRSRDPRSAMAGAVGGMFGHKKDKPADKPGTSPGGGAAPGTLSITTDVLSITTGAAGASFDVPAGYKKVERRH